MILYRGQDWRGCRMHAFEHPNAADLSGLRTGSIIDLLCHGTKVARISVSKVSVTATMLLPTTDRAIMTE